MLEDRDLGGGREGAKTQRQEVTMQVWRQARDSLMTGVCLGRGKWRLELDHEAAGGISQ